MYNDLRFAFRILHRMPGFSLAITLTLALGIACNGAIFAVVDAVLFRPLPYAEQERLIQLGETYKGSHFGNVPFPTFLDWKQQSRCFEGLAGSFSLEMITRGENEPASLLARWVTPDFFDVFRAEAAFGRLFLPQDFASNSAPSVILSHRFWSSGLGSRPDVIGQSLVLNGTAHTVVGVMPSSFRDYSELEADLRFGAGSKVDLWVPLVTDRLPIPPAWATNRSEELLEVVGRLNRGSDLTQPQTEMKLIAERLSQLYPASNKDRGVIVKKLQDTLRDDNRAPLFLLWTAVGFLLLIACANAANLLLSRSTARQKEIAIRIAVGASRWQIMRQLLLESIMLALLGGVAGVVLAAQAVEFMNSFRLSSSLVMPEIRVDFRVLLFMFLTSLFTAALFGLVPALRSSSVDLDQALRTGEKGSTEGGHRSRLAGLLVVAEVSLSLVLSVGCGLLMRSLIRLLQVNPGFVPEGVLTMLIDLPNSRYPTAPQQIQFFQSTLEKVGAISGVQAAALANLLPMNNSSSTVGVLAEGEPQSPQVRHSAEVHYVSTGYLKALGIVLLQGRFISERDAQGGVAVVVVNKTLVRQTCRNQFPVGTRIQLGGQWRIIVGVVGDVKHGGMAAEIVPETYIPYAQNPTVSRMYLVARTKGDPLSLVSSVRNAIYSVDSSQPVGEVCTLESILSRNTAPRRMILTLMALFAILSVFLAAVGIYGVISFAVSRRTKELGIRMALGALPRDVLFMTLQQGMKLVLYGLGLGILMASLLTQFLASQLFAVTATDLPTFLIVSLVLGIVALAACFIPAKRAATIEPLTAIRYE